MSNLFDDVINAYKKKEEVNDRVTKDQQEKETEKARILSDIQEQISGELTVVDDAAVHARLKEEFDEEELEAIRKRARKATPFWKRRAL